MELDAEFGKWRSWPLPEIIYLTLDATFYKVRIDGTVRDCATLIAIGTRQDDGKRMILGVSCAVSEAEVHWRKFAKGLRERGIGIPDLVTSDAHTGLRAALKAYFSAPRGNAASSTSSKTPSNTSPSRISKTRSLPTSPPFSTSMTARTHKPA
jgi:transposase-like protein